jgi:hypothetical protein
MSVATTMTFVLCLLSFWAGGLFGYVVAAMLAAAGRGDEQSGGFR